MLIKLLNFALIFAITADNFENNLTRRRTKAALWLPRPFRIICCFGGHPVPQNPQMIRNWTLQESNHLISDHTSEDDILTDSKNDTRRREIALSSCRVYHGNYLLSASALFTLDDFSGINVKCKCPNASNSQNLDKSCRPLKPCLNKGHRSRNSNLLCICPEPYFGDHCGKYCDQGERIKGADGRYYCACIPFYVGEECRDMVCLNGGTEVRRRCRCPPNFFGYHCEIDANHTSVVSRFHGYEEQAVYQDSDLFSRDISSTIFSVVMILVLVLSMYLLMKHRMQVQNRVTAFRREAVLRSAMEFNPRRIIREDSNYLSFQVIPFRNEGPPPYVITSQRGRTRRRDNDLPPLPNYEDAIKLPAFIRTPLEEESSVEVDESITTDERSPNESEISCSTREENIAELCTPVYSLPVNESIVESVAEPSSSVLRRESPSPCINAIFQTDNDFKLSRDLSTRRSI
ncbi:unnamed protein product [Thelazia callipaeda]|uniref:EGF-like domain-containing protein n=1 Tax=Thelazia callipaeda TaxID=103827 RepID=A0A0N5DB84_THECL|nr:unnamed protein product [Thelazia callipaeda]